MNAPFQRSGSGDPVLVGLAPDERSDFAVRQACTLAEAIGAPLEVVHAVTSPQGTWTTLRPLQRAAANGLALTRAQQYASERLRDLVAGTAFEGRESEWLRVLPGTPARVLLERSQEAPASFLVLGSHRRRGVLDFGRTVRAVLALTSVPVWVQSRAPQPIRRILAPVDLTTESHRTLGCAAMLARTLGASVRVVHCHSAALHAYAGDFGFPVHEAIPSMPGPEDLRADAEERLRGFVGEFPWHGVEHTEDLLEVEAVRGILDLQESADLIVMGTQGEARFSAAVLGSVAYAVLRDAETPVVAVPHADG